jgi:hypothetical protein
MRNERYVKATFSTRLMEAELAQRKTTFPILHNEPPLPEISC